MREANSIKVIVDKVSVASGSGSTPYCCNCQSPFDNMRRTMRQVVVLKYSHPISLAGESDRPCFGCGAAVPVIVSRQARELQPSENTERARQRCQKPGSVSTNKLRKISSGIIFC